MTVFGRYYAGFYDLLYGDKDYEAECDLLENAFKRFGNGSIESVIDLGCGTGSHAIPLARRGYRVTGVDLSEPMLSRSATKAKTSLDAAGQARLTLRHGDVRTVDLGRSFDAVLMMFAVLGYQLTNEDVLATLRSVRRHLNRDGLFVFDVWYGPAVLTLRPEDRVKTVSTERGEIRRSASTRLDVFSHTAEVRYRVEDHTGGGEARDTEEVHRMRFFFPQELRLFLEHTGFNVVAMCAFPSLDRGPVETDWNVLVAAR